MALKRKRITPEIRWHCRGKILYVRSDGTAGAQDYIFFHGHGNSDHH
jgi:hypothetical protein